MAQDHYVFLAGSISGIMEGVTIQVRGLATVPAVDRRAYIPYACYAVSEHGSWCWNVCIVNGYQCAALAPKQHSLAPGHLTAALYVHQQGTHILQGCSYTIHNSGALTCCRAPQLPSTLTYCSHSI